MLQQKRVVVWLAVAGVGLVVWLAQAQQTQAVTSATLLNAAEDGEEWLTYGHDYSETHFSPLTQINTKNVKRLWRGRRWRTLFGNPESSTALYQASVGVIAAGRAQGFGALFPKGSEGSLSVLPDLVGKTVEAGVRAGYSLAGATAEAAEAAASPVGAVLLAGYGAVTAAEFTYCAVHH